MKDWRALALVLIGLVTGGGVSAAVGAVQLNTAKVELRKEIEKVDLDGQSTFAAVALLSIAMARIEEQLKAANDKLDNLAR